MTKNTSLIKAKKGKKDEFYTQLSDIENELQYYGRHFENKTILCNCDDPRRSNFSNYFFNNFKRLKLKKLFVTCYNTRQIKLFGENVIKPAVYFEYDGDDKISNLNEIRIKNLKGDGDFRSAECLEFLKQADIIVTNPPFSLFREYIAQLIKYEKKFLLVGNPNAISYKEIFKLIKKNRMWIGMSSMGKDMFFDIPKEYARQFVKTKKEGSVYKIINGVIKGRTPSIWFTNLDVRKRHEKLALHKKYNPKEYPKYDNYDAINIDKIKEIPVDYGGVMGVPITFMEWYNPDQFEIVGQMSTTKIDEFNYGYPYINGKKVYARILIKAKKHSNC